jgi:peptidoglycan hydrolase CwlO-like protein
LAEEMLLKEADHTEMQSQVLKVKSELVDKQAQIEELFATLTEKGEETAELSRKLIMLKNHILD